MGVSLRDFVSNYPFPAFLLSAKPGVGNYGTSLSPAFSNAHFRRLVTGNESALEAETTTMWMQALGTVQVTKNLSLWLMPAPVDAASSDAITEESPVLDVALSPAWIPKDLLPIKLQLVKTLCRGYYVVTSSPLSTPLPPPPKPQSPPKSPSTGLRRAASAGLRLPNFPPVNPLLTSPTSSPDTLHENAEERPKAEHVSSPPPPRFETTASDCDAEVRRMLQDFNWADTPLGPLDSWPDTLKCITGIVMENPFPCAIWYGPELHLIYNGAYGAMAGNKHPKLFGQAGAVAWGEIWEQMGPHVDGVLRGKAVARQDELLFYERLGPRRLPEETYHSWSWTPIPGPSTSSPSSLTSPTSSLPSLSPSVVGLFQFTFETTYSVVAARRLKVLRDLCEQAMIAPTIKTFGKVLLDVFSGVQYEAPFAALYTCTATGREGAGEGRHGHHRGGSGGEKSDSGSGTGSGSGSGASGASGSSGPTPISFRVNLVGSLGIPDQPDKSQSHPMFPRSFHAQLAVGSSARHSNSSGRGGSGGDSSHSSQRSELISDESHASLSAGSSTQQSSTARDRFSTTGSASARSPSAAAATPPGRAGAQGQGQGATTFDWSPYIADAMRAGYSIHVPVLPADLMHDVGLDRGWHDHVREAVVIPIVAEGDVAETAVLILGINTRRPYNAIYWNWVDVLRMTLGSSLNAVLGREAETRRADQLAQLDSAKTAFFSNASHELRTPLTLIGGPLNEALESGITDRRVRERLSLAARNVARLSRLVDSLMDFSRIEGGKLTGRFRPVMLSPFTADLAALFRSTIERNGIEYNVDCDIQDESIVYVDPEMWEKVVFNLVGNAFKYTLEGGITVKMRFSPLWATFVVQDTGVGIPNEDMDRIFERFHRVAATSRSHEGTGIGLALTKELVRLHGGNLTVTSQHARDNSDGPHGSTFTVTIPMGHAHIPKTHLEENPSATITQRTYARGIIDEAAQWGRGTGVDTNTPSDTSDSPEHFGGGDSGTVFFQKSDVVLIVDDNSDMRRYIRSIFSPYCTVADARDGQEALDMMDAGIVKPDVVVTDRVMPVLDGDELLQAIRQRPTLRTIPVVMVTADAGDEARLDGLLSGADDYIPKPFTSKQLIARTHLQMQIGKRKAELEAKFEATTSELRVLSELAPVGIFRADTHGHIIWANPMWHELTEHAVGAALDDWTHFVSESDRETVTRAYHGLCQTLEPQRLVMEFTFTSGRCVQAQFNVLDLKILGVPSILGTFTDISERRMLQQAQLHHAEEREAAARHKAEESDLRRQEAEERRRAQELLIDVTSHELRQPVSAILNCASLVRSNYRTLRSEMFEAQVNKSNFTPSPDLFSTMDEDLQALDAIYQCGLSQERIANDVLSLSRMQLEVLSIHPVDFELEEEVKRISSLFSNELHMKDISFSLTAGPSVKALRITRVCLDRSRFGQIVTNLLSNAIKFTDISAVSRREIRLEFDVSIHPPQQDSCKPPAPLPLPASDKPYDGPIYLYMAVRDSGPGLKPADLALLFQRFAQGSNSHEVFGGSGLGLFVSRKLCELMGGRIEVDSQYGQGATFRFFIQGTVSKQTPAELAHIHSASPTKAIVTRTLRVLITEDNHINQTVLNRQLKKAGCLTSLASNGVEALDNIRQLREDNNTMFDVILMDCEMPVMNGYTAVREIRRMEQEGVFPHRNYVIALTGNARSAQVQSARDAGMDEVMIKPYKIDELLRKMQDHAQHSPIPRHIPLPHNIPLPPTPLEVSGTKYPGF